MFNSIAELYELAPGNLAFYANIIQENRLDCRVFHEQCR